MLHFSPHVLLSLFFLLPILQGCGGGLEPDIFTDDVDGHSHAEWEDPETGVMIVLEKFVETGNVRACYLRSSKNITFRIRKAEIQLERGEVTQWVKTLDATQPLNIEEVNNLAQFYIYDYLDGKLLGFISISK